MKDNHYKNNDFKVKIMRGIRELLPEEKAIPRKQIFQEFWIYVRTQKRIFIGLAISLLIHGCVIGGGIWLVKAAIDQIFDSTSTVAKSEIALLIGALFLVTVIKNLIDFLSNWLQNLAISRIRDKMIIKAFSNLLNTSFSFHIQKRNSKKYGWVLKDTNYFIQSFFGIFRIWIQNPITIISTIIALIVINWKLTLIGILLLPISLPCIFFMKRKSKEFITQRKKLIGLVEEIISEAIYGIRIIKAFALEQREIDKLNTIVNKQREVNLRNAFFIGLMSPISEFLGFLGLSVILIVGSQTSLIGAFTPGTFFAFLMSFLNIYRPLKGFSSGMMMYQQVLDSGRRLIILQNRAGENLQKYGTVSITHFQSLRFKNVCFSYREDPQESDYVLKNINLELHQGETLALMGKTGAGKTTLCDLIFRLFQVQQGMILINGIPLQQIENKSYRRIFAMCSQETIIFNNTLLENIRIANPNVSRKEVKSLIEALRLSTYVDSLPKGIDTSIGDRGIQLSGGQRQRVAIARALLQKPTFLVLDEAMSGLDMETEEQIWKNIHQLLPDCSILLVSHRWYNMHFCNRVLILSQGRLVADRPVKTIDQPYQFLRKFLSKETVH